MSMNVEAEIRDLKRRVGELEGSFGFPTQQTKAVHKDLLAFEEKTEDRFKHVDARFDKVDVQLDRVESRLDLVDTNVRTLGHDMPKIVGQAMREVLDERRGKS
jgi:hypothetical protein